MVARLCQEFGIPISVGEMLVLSSRTFQMLAVSVLAMKEKQAMDMESKKDLQGSRTGHGQK
ncbi:MAG: hypothetical protein ACYC7D_05350 [Nitrososphaerales archaeon]